ncbi:MAG: hypothetical protein SU899_03415 [Chloroflexota bacterium]|nr:hypothetical protein [Chloroflexota bacterium]
MTVGKGKSLKRLFLTFLKYKTINLNWNQAASPDLKPQIAQALDTFADNTHHLSLRTHRLSRRLNGMWAFVLAYDCRVMLQCLDDQEVSNLA